MKAICIHHHGPSDALTQGGTGGVGSIAMQLSRGTPLRATAA